MKIKGANTDFVAKATMSESDNPKVITKTQLNECLVIF